MPVCEDVGCVCVCVCARVCVCVCLCFCVLCVCVFFCICVYVCECLCARVCVFACVCVLCVCVFWCVCVYVFLREFGGVGVCLFVFFSHLRTRACSSQFVCLRVHDFACVHSVPSSTSRLAWSWAGMCAQVCVYVCLRTCVCVGAHGWGGCVVCAQACFLCLAHTTLESLPSEMSVSTA